MKPCPDCNGKGWTWQRFSNYGGKNTMAQCLMCEGEGEMREALVELSDFSAVGTQEHNIIDAALALSSPDHDKRAS